VIGLAVAIGVDGLRRVGARFDRIGDAVIVGIGVSEIRNPIRVRVHRLRGRIGIAGLDFVRNTVAIRVVVDVIGLAVTVGVGWVAVRSRLIGVGHVVVVFVDGWLEHFGAPLLRSRVEGAAALVQDRCMVRNTVGGDDLGDRGRHASFVLGRPIDVRPPFRRIAVFPLLRCRVERGSAVRHDDIGVAHGDAVDRLTDGEIFGTRQTLRLAESL